VVQRVGNIDPAYVQQMGDFDYGLRARAAGCEVCVAPGTVGTCASNPERRTDLQPLRRELTRLWSVKELAPRPWLLFTRRWAGRLWPIYWLSPYLRRGLGLVLQRASFRHPVSRVR
jgi:GT2 family glycosyltransferase